MSHRVLAWTAAVVLLFAALAVAFVTAGWHWRNYVIIVAAVLAFAWFAYFLDDISDRHAVGEDDWDAYVIAQMERDLAGDDSDKDAAPSPPSPGEPSEPRPPRRRGVLGRIGERIRQIDWSDDRSTVVGWPRRSDSG